MIKLICKLRYKKLFLVDRILWIKSSFTGIHKRVFTILFRRIIAGYAFVVWYAKVM